MEFIKDQEKRILLSAISREEKVIKEDKELAELIPVINQLNYYFMYDRLFKQIYNKGFMDGVNDQAERYKDSAYRQKHDTELIDKVAEKIRENSGLHYVDCDGYFGGIAELIFKVDDWLDDIIAELKAEVSK